MRFLPNVVPRATKWLLSCRIFAMAKMSPGYTHNIVNLSETEDLVTFMWCNECFDPARPDTYFEKV